MKRIWKFCAASLTSAFFALGSAGTGHADTAEIVFSAAEKAIISNYYGGGDTARGFKDKKGGQGKGIGSQGMPPGLAKKGQLPPGIAKRQLPSALARQLPPPPAGFERIIVDNDILLVEVATQVVHDVLTDVVRNR